MTTSAGVSPGAAVDEDRVQRFLEKVITDTGAAVAGLCTSLGDRLGLYTAMAGAGPLTSAQLAARTGLAERYVREWLAAQVAGEYIGYAPGTDTYLLPDEHAAVLADPDLPTYAAGFSTLLQAIYATEDTLMEAFRTGEGVGWEEHGPALFAGSAKFFRPGYAASLVPEWLTALDGVVEKLERGARVADVGCGYGYSTTLMAQAFPRSHFDGFDFHRPSVEAARGLVAEQGLERPGQLRGRHRPGLPRRGLRPDHVLRLPARHRRSGRRAAPRRAGAGRRRNLHGRRAERLGRRAGERQPHRPGADRRLGRRLPAVRAGPARTAGTGKPRG